MIEHCVFLKNINLLVQDFNFTKRDYFNLQIRWNTLIRREIIKKINNKFKPRNKK